MSSIMTITNNTVSQATNNHRRYYVHNPYSPIRREHGFYVEDAIQEYKKIISKQQEQEKQNQIDAAAEVFCFDDGADDSQEQEQLLSLNNNYDHADDEDQQGENVFEEQNAIVNQQPEQEQPEFLRNIMIDANGNYRTKEDMKLLAVYNDLKVSAPESKLRQSWWWRDPAHVNNQYYQETQKLPKMAPPKLFGSEILLAQKQKQRQQQHDHDNSCNNHRRNAKDDDEEYHDGQSGNIECNSKTSQSTSSRISFFRNEPSEKYAADIHMLVHETRDDGYSFRSVTAGSILPPLYSGSEGISHELTIYDGNKTNHRKNNNNSPHHAASTSSVTKPIITTNSSFLLLTNNNQDTPPRTAPSSTHNNNNNAVASACSISPASSSSLTSPSRHNNNIHHQKQQRDQNNETIAADLYFGNSSSSGSPSPFETPSSTPRKYSFQHQQQHQRQYNYMDEYDVSDNDFANEDLNQSKSQCSPFLLQSSSNSNNNNNDNIRQENEIFVYQVTFRAHKDFFRFVCDNNTSLQIGDHVLVEAISSCTSSFQDEHANYDLGKIEKKIPLDSYFGSNQNSRNQWSQYLNLPMIFCLASQNLIDQLYREQHQVEVESDQRNHQHQNNNSVTPTPTTASVIQFLDQLPYLVIKCRQILRQYHEKKKQHQEALRFYALNSFCNGNDEDEDEEETVYDISSTKRRHADTESSAAESASSSSLAPLPDLYQFRRQMRDPLLHLCPLVPPSDAALSEILDLYKKYNFLNAEFQHDKKSLCIYFADSNRYFLRTVAQCNQNRGHVRNNAANRNSNNNNNNANTTNNNYSFGGRFSHPQAVSFISESICSQTYEFHGSSRNDNSSSLVTDSCYCIENSSNYFFHNQFGSIMQLLIRKFQNCKIWMMNCGVRAKQLEAHPFHSWTLNHFATKRQEEIMENDDLLLLLLPENEEQHCEYYFSDKNTNDNNNDNNNYDEDAEIEKQLSSFLFNQREVLDVDECEENDDEEKYHNECCTSSSSTNLQEQESVVISFPVPRSEQRNAKCSSMPDSQPPAYFSGMISSKGKYGNSKRYINFKY